MKVRITKAVLDSIRPGEKVEFVRDADLQGFGVRVTPGGAMSFVVERKMSGKTVRVTIGRVGPWTLTQARAEALQLLAQMDRGINPNERAAPDPEPPTAQPSDLTLNGLLEAYLSERASTVPAMKRRTADGYRALLNRCFEDWMAKPFTDISKQAVVERMAKLTGKGATQANSAMRALRAVLNWAIDSESYLDASGESLMQVNPTMVLKQRRLWNKERRKSTLLDRETLPAWWAAVDRVRTEDWPGRADVIRDYWRTMLLTGMRPGEAARIELDGWDERNREIRLADTKNRTEIFTLPVGEFAAAMLSERARKSREAGSRFLFPAARREVGYTSTGHEIKQAMCIATGLRWAFNDLRRTFASELDRLGVSSYMIKRILGHKVSADVTGGYVLHDREQIREVMQRAENALLAAAKVRSGT